MTEDEAKTKWCPQARQAVATSRDLAASATANRDSGEHYGADNCNCLGSACMWWRWISKAGTSEDGTANYYTGKWKGYCGPAGKP